jgi:serine/threonine protein kinase
MNTSNQRADSLIGNTIDDKYRIESILGAGGMGTVYLCTRLMIGDTVAIKVLHIDRVSDAQAVERFRREAQAAARLKHPNAVSIYDFGVSNNGLVYLVMELVEGESLRSLIKQQGPLTPSAAGEILSQICAALDEAHRQHIVHRDLKPDNIIVTTAAGGLRVKVLDFGIAKMRDLATAADNLTQTGTVMGTPHYMSPEQCLGEELDGRSDIYSAGIMLYEMLSGMVPFNSPASTAVIVQHVTQPPPPLRAINASISPAVEAVVMHALEKPREARPQTAGTFAQEMIAAVSGTAVAQPVTTGFVIANPSRPLTASGTAAGMAPTMRMRTPTFSGAVTPAGVQPVPSGAQPARARSKTVLIIVAAVILMAVAAAVAVWVTKTGDKKTEAPIKTPAQGDKDTSTSQSWEAEVTATLGRWVAALEAHDLDTHMSYFAETLDTYHSQRNVGAARVRADLARAFSRYSTLSVRLSGIRVTFDRNNESASVTLDKTWTFANGPNTAAEKTWSGSVRQMLWLRRIEGRWRITGLKDA